MSRRSIERALNAARNELGIRTSFPADVVAEAERAAARTAEPGPDREDRRDLPLVTIDPPGSRDLDQALAFQPEDGGMRLWYAIADVGFFVDRGGALEAEAWRRVLTYYAPDQTQPLYPPVLSQGAGSLLPGEDRPCILFDIVVDAGGRVVSRAVGRALVRSRAQLTYAEVSDHVLAGETRFAGEDWASSLPLLRRFGELRQRREAERGGVSLPLVDQHVVQRAAAQLGYAVEFERGEPSEEWNEQVSLLTGHTAAEWMLEAGVGMLRVMGAPDPEARAAFRRAARAMGFAWPEGMPYPDFIRSLDVHHPCITPLLWQAKPVMRGADYLAFQGEPPPDPLHHALAMPYAHATAPLRRLGDRYVLDLLVQLASGARPSADQVETLRRLPPVLDAAERTQNRLERRGVDLAEAWTLAGRTGERFAAVVLGPRGDAVEVQIEDPPVRALADAAGDAPRPAPGDSVTVRLDRVDLSRGRVHLRLVG